MLCFLNYLFSFFPFTLTFLHSSLSILFTIYLSHYHLPFSLPSTFLTTIYPSHHHLPFSPSSTFLITICLSHYHLPFSLPYTLLTTISTISLPSLLTVISTISLLYLLSSSATTVVVPIVTVTHRRRHLSPPSPIAVVTHRLCKSSSPSINTQYLHQTTAIYCHLLPYYAIYRVTKSDLQPPRGVIWKAC